MIYELLIKLGYRVNCKTGNRFRLINNIDIIFLIAYIVTSTYNFIISEPSYCVWWLNILIMIRIIIRNVLETKRIKEPPSEEHDSTNVRKIIIIRFIPYRTIFEAGITVCMFASMIIGRIYGTAQELTSGSFGIWFTFIGFAVLLISFLEDLLKIMEQLYDAKIEPLVIQTEHT